MLFSNKKPILAVAIFNRSKEKQKVLLNEFIKEFNDSMLKLTEYDKNIYKPMTEESFIPDASADYFHIYSGDDIVGFFGLRNDRELFTTWVVEFFIQEEFRSVENCKQILNFVKNYMSLEKMKYLSMGVFNIPSILKLCGKLGFTPVKTTLMLKFGL